MAEEQSDGTPLHTPVLRAEVLRYLDPEPGEVMVDCTFGSGGHARAIAERLGSDGLLVALDWDPRAPEYAGFDPDDAACEVVFRNENFARIGDVLAREGIEGVDGVLADLGWSMDQLRRSELGLTFERDEYLDMRLNPEADETAADLLSNRSVEELQELFRTHGEHRQGRRIAKKIVDTRERRPLQRTLQLYDLIGSVTGKGHQKKAATRVFQALRTEVNSELESLDRLLNQLPQLLATGGRGCVISFHSLEDRRVKLAFEEGHRNGTYQRLTEKPVRPERDELDQNPSARSARLRAVERRNS